MWYGEKEYQYDCRGAEQVLLRALELGNREAPYLLGRYFASAECTRRRRNEAIGWFEKGAAVGDWRAAEQAARWYGAPHPLPERSLTYGLATDLLSGRQHFTEAEYVVGKLDGAAKGRAEAEAQRIFAEAKSTLPPTGDVRREPVDTAGSAGDPAGWSFRVERVDHTHRCAYNLRGNCAGVPFLVVYALTSTQDRFLLCRLHLTYSPFGGGEPAALERQALLAPAATREVIVGEVDGPIAAGVAGAACEPLYPDPRGPDGGAACGARRASGATTDYPADALKSGVEGSVAVRVFVRHSGELPADVEILQSSGSFALDEAARKGFLRQKFATTCDNAFGSFRMDFKLEQ